MAGWTRLRYRGAWLTDAATRGDAAERAFAYIFVHCGAARSLHQSPTADMNEELSDVPDITATELAVRLDAGDVPVLLDVREHYEAEIADLPEHGQVRIPTGEFAELLEELDRHGEPVIYCTIGSRSAWATRLLPLV